VQYSSNSNAAMVAIIRSRPTLIGQYRQAKLEVWRRQQDLESVALQLQKEEIELELAKLQTPTLGIDAETRLKIKLAAIAAAEMSRKIQTTADLAKDTQRELQICEVELNRIRAEAEAIGLNLDELSESQFQILMAEEFKAKRARYFAAQFLAPQIGVMAGAIEEFLEIPEADRRDIIQLQSAYMNGFAALLPEAQN
jgi:hypothetical protein